MMAHRIRFLFSGKPSAQCWALQQSLNLEVCNVEVMWTTQEVLQRLL